MLLGQLKSWPVSRHWAAFPVDMNWPPPTWCSPSGRGLSIHKGDPQLFQHRSWSLSRWHSRTQTGTSEKPTSFKSARCTIRNISELEEMKQTNPHQHLPAITTLWWEIGVLWLWENPVSLTFVLCSPSHIVMARPLRWSHWNPNQRVL